MKKKIIIIGFIFVVICLFVYHIHNAYKIKSAYVVCENMNVNEKISNRSDISLIKRLLTNQTKVYSPSCPFGYITLTVEIGNRTVDILPAMDGCKILKIGTKYYSIPSNEWEQMESMFEHYGIQKGILSEGKGI